MINSIMRRMKFLSIVATVMLVHLHATYTAVVDTKTPIVIYDNGDASDTIANDNYFGYSLAFSKGKLKETVTLFIGAPNEKRVTKNSGIVWKCHFNGGKALLSCSIMREISQQNSPKKTECSKRLDSRKYPFQETDQWIGASLAASSSQLYACAPRWKRNSWEGEDPPHCKSESAMVGACYNVTSRTKLDVLTPLDYQTSFYYQETFGPKVSHFWLLYAQVGFSSHLTPFNSLLIGAPSVRTWRGAIVEYQNNGHSGAVIHNLYGEINGVEAQSLLGYTVTSGRIYHQGSYIASGAPRAENLYGAVTIIYPRTHYRPTTILKGEQFGSYFGYALATADLNGDGYDELLVGAPWQMDSSKTSSTFSSGCVQIFDVKNNWRFPSTKLYMSVQPTAQQSMGSRFGSAICSLGDINFDQRDDFAISAPYDDEGVGTIFIYYGGDPPATTPTQIIRGRAMSITNLRGFGTHLIGGSGVDVDENGTPDLVISSFESRHVVVLRTRPVAKPEMKVSFHKDGSSGSQRKIVKLSPTEKRFRARICFRFKFSVTPEDETKKLALWVKFEVQSKGVRAQFDNPSHQTEHRYELPFSGDCVDTKLELVGDTSREGNDNHIQFQTIVRYNETELLDSQPVEHASLQISSTRAKDQQNEEFVQDSQYQRAYKRFTSHLPAPIPPRYSRKERLAIANDNCDSDGKPECDPELHVNLKISYGQTSGGKRAEWNSSQILLVGKLDLMAVSITVTNKKETAYQPTVRVTIGMGSNFEMNSKSIVFQWSPGKRGQCNTEQNTTKDQGNSLIIQTMQCPQPLQQKSTVNYLLEIGNLKDVKVRGPQSTGELTLTVDAFPASREEDKKKSETLKIPLKGDVVIGIEIPPTTGQPEIDPKTTGVVGLTQLYTIKNSGVSATSMDKVKTEILVPTRFNLNDENNLTQIIGVSNPSNLNIRCKAVNFEFFSIQQLEIERDESTQLSPSESAPSRSTRSVSSSPEKVTVSTSADKYLVLSDCKQDSLHPEACQKIVCHMDLPSNGLREITLKMYFLKDGIEKLVNEETKGIRVQSIISVDYLGKITRATGSSQRDFILMKSIAAWIYLLSAAGGALLLFLFSFALFKCGFFRRQAKEQLKELKRQTMMQMDASALQQLDENIGGQEQEEILKNDNSPGNYNSCRQILN